MTLGKCPSDRRVVVIQPGQAGMQFRVLVLHLLKILVGLVESPAGIFEFSERLFLDLAGAHGNAL